MSNQTLADITPCTPAAAKHREFGVMEGWAILLWLLLARLLLVRLPSALPLPLLPLYLPAQDALIKVLTSTYNGAVSSTPDN